MEAAALERSGRTIPAVRGRAERLIPLGLALAGFALAFAQRPGLNTADTKVNLHVDPLRFLADLVSVWSPTASLGHVQGGQYSGYLWPMGPFFALGHLLGLSGWVTERLWLGALFALAAWGVVRLADELLDRRRGVMHLVAGAVFLANPYVVVFANRTSIFLLAYAALPWLMVIVHRGLRRPRNWWWPAAFALVTTSTGGGVNATVTALVMIGPILLVLYEVGIGEIAPRAAVSFGWRVILATGASSVWWVAPLLVQSKYGLNFLQFTEQVGAIWGTTSLTESLRLMSYWPSYLGVGYTDRLLPYFNDSPTMLFDPAVVVSSLLVPALALGGYVVTRSRRYAPLLLACALVALLVMSVGYPTGTLLRSGVTFIYNRVAAVQFLRTTYKAGPVLALAVALLLGAAAGAGWTGIRGLNTRNRRLTAQAGLLALAAALVVLSSLPLFEGRGLELTFKAVPSAWRQAGHDLDASLPANSRALVLPGQAYGFYNWGGTVDPLMPALTKRPVAVRNTPPYDDLHAVDFLWTVDDLVQQQRLLPGELGPLLSLMSVRAVITATDDDDARSGAVAPQAAASVLSRQAGLGQPARAYGPQRTFASPAQTAAPPARLPEVRRYDVPARGLVRIEPTSSPTIVDGSAQGVADVAALGELPASRPLFYAGDETAPTLRGQAQDGADVFITDSNRRQVFVASTVRQNLGATEPTDQAFSPDAAELDPFVARGTNAQTVSVLQGVRSITAPYNPELPQFPEQRPFAAFDGNPNTAWVADPTLDPSRHWVQVTFNAPRDVASIELLPDQSDPAIRLTEVQVNGHNFALHPGYNHLVLNLHDVAALRITLIHAESLGHDTGGTGGLAEVRIPGIHVRELLRPPVLTEDALRGVALGHTALNYVFERTTADDPLERGPEPAEQVVHGDRLQAAAALIRLAQDGETSITRVIDPPAARQWTVSGLATVTPTAPDQELDTLARTVTPGDTFSSSGRLDGLPGYRASRAFDGSASTAWIAPLAPYQPAWLQWTSRRPITLRRFTLVRSSRPVRFPTRVAISIVSTRGAVSTPLSMKVGPGGVISLPKTLTADGFRLQVLAAAGSSRASVGIAEITGTGIPRAQTTASGGTVAGRCGQASAEVGGRAVALRLGGTVATLDAAEPLTLTACGGPVALPAATTTVTIGQGLVRPLLVSLRSPAPQPLATTASTDAPTGSVTNSGDQGDGSYTGVRVRVSAPSWLVLGESYNRGWTATCNGRSLGPSRVIDAFANGWPVRPGCRDVAITFSPQSDVDIGYLIGGLACALLLIVLLVARPGPPPSDGEPVALPPAARFPQLSPGRAVAAGVALAAVGGFVFALRSGAIIGPVAAVILWRGFPVRRLLLIAAGLLVIVIPLLYLLFPGVNQGGYSLGYTAQHLGAHWVAVGAVALLIAALARDLSTAMRRPRDDRAPAPAPRA